MRRIWQENAGIEGIYSSRKRALQRSTRKEKAQGKKEKKGKRKKTPKKEKEKRDIPEIMGESVGDGYDGHYNDVLPPDTDRVKDGLDKELIKKIAELCICMAVINLGRCETEPTTKPSINARWAMKKLLNHPKTLWPLIATASIRTVNIPNGTKQTIIDRNIKAYIQGELAMKIMIDYDLSMEPSSKHLPHEEAYPL